MQTRSDRQLSRAVPALATGRLPRMTRPALTAAAFAILASLVVLSARAWAQMPANLKGWGGEVVRSFPGYLGEAPAVMESTCLGYSLVIAPPTAECAASGGFRAQITLMNGTLPPGFTLHENGRIAGDPTQTGNWLVKLKADPLECGEKRFIGFQQLVDIQVLSRKECVNDQAPDRPHPDSVTRKRHHRSD